MEQDSGTFGPSSCGKGCRDEPSPLQTPSTAWSADFSSVNGSPIAKGPNVDRSTAVGPGNYLPRWGSPLAINRSLYGSASPREPSLDNTTNSGSNIHRHSDQGNRVISARFPTSVSGNEVDVNNGTTPTSNNNSNIYEHRHTRSAGSMEWAKASTGNDSPRFTTTSQRITAGGKVPPPDIIPQRHERQNSNDSAVDLRRLDSDRSYWITREASARKSSRICSGRAGTDENAAVAVNGTNQPGTATTASASNALAPAAAAAVGATAPAGAAPSMYGTIPIPTTDNTSPVRCSRAGYYARTITKPSQASPSTSVTSCDAKSAEASYQQRQQQQQQQQQKPQRQQYGDPFTMAGNSNADASEAGTARPPLHNNGTALDTATANTTSASAVALSTTNSNNSTVIAGGGGSNAPALSAPGSVSTSRAQSTTPPAAVTAGVVAPAADASGHRINATLATRRTLSNSSTYFVRAATDERQSSARASSRADSQVPTPVHEPLPAQRADTGAASARATSKTASKSPTGAVKRGNILPVARSEDPDSTNSGSGSNSNSDGTTDELGATGTHSNLGAGTTAATAATTTGGVARAPPATSSGDSDATAARANTRVAAPTTTAATTTGVDVPLRRSGPNASGTSSPRVFTTTTSNNNNTSARATASPSFSSGNHSASPLGRRVAPSKEASTSNNGGDSGRGRAAVSGKSSVSSGSPRSARVLSQRHQHPPPFSSQASSPTSVPCSSSSAAVAALVAAPLSANDAAPLTVPSSGTKPLVSTFATSSSTPSNGNTTTNTTATRTSTTATGTSAGAKAPAASAAATVTRASQDAVPLAVPRDEPCYTSSRAVLERLVQRWRNRYEENKNAYSAGGYLNVIPGKLLHSRYVMIQKLGYGEFSTVWLAYDTKYASQGRRGARQAFVAVKIAKCDSTVRESTQYEIFLLRYLNSSLAQDTPSTTLIDVFEVAGEFGQHHCMVMPVHGSNLLAIIDYMKGKRRERRTPEEILLVKELLCSVLHGLRALKDINVIHTDIKPENVLCYAPDAKVLSTMETFCVRNKNRSHVMPADYVRRYVAQADPQHLVCLADFGLSAVLEPPSSPTYFAKDTHTRSLLSRLLSRKREFPVSHPGVVDNTYGTLIQTREYRAPEVLLGMNFTCETDIWSVGCMAFELITGEFLMDPKRKTRDERRMDIEHFAMMIQLLGKPPREITALRTNNNFHDRQRLWMRGGGGSRPAVPSTAPPPPVYINRFLDARGAFIYADRCNCAPRRLSEELEPYFETKAEAAQAADFVLSCLGSYDPMKRPSAAKMLEHPWLSGVGRGAAAAAPAADTRDTHTSIPVAASGNGNHNIASGCVGPRVDKSGCPGSKLQDIYSGDSLRQQGSS